VDGDEDSETGEQMITELTEDDIDNFDDDVPERMRNNATRIDIPVCVSESNILVTTRRAVGGGTMLINPEGRNTIDDSSVFVTINDFFTTIKIENPAPGPWRLYIDGNRDDVERVSFTNSFDIDFRVSAEAELMSVMEPVTVKASLIVPRGVTDLEAVAALFNNVTCTVIHRRRSEDVRLRWTGEYFEGEFRPTLPGHHTFVVTGLGQALNITSSEPYEAEVAAAGEIFVPTPPSMRDRPSISIDDIEPPDITVIPIWLAYVIVVLAVGAVGVGLFLGAKKVLSNMGPKFKGKLNIIYFDDGKAIGSTHRLPLFLTRNIRTMADIMNQNEPKIALSDGMKKLAENTDLKKILVKPGEKVNIIIKNMSSLCVDIESGQSYGLPTDKKVRTGIKFGTDVKWTVGKQAVICFKSEITKAIEENISDDAKPIYEIRMMYED
jgi:hypothetical protein